MVPAWQIFRLWVDAGTPGSEHMAHLTTGASAVVEGKLVACRAQGQKWNWRGGGENFNLVGVAV